MLAKLIGRTIEAVKIYKPMKGRKIYGYNVGDMKEKLIDTSTTNFVIYHKKGKVSLIKPRECTDYIILSCTGTSDAYGYKDIIKEMKKLIGNKIIEVEFKKREENETYGMLYRMDEYYILKLSNGDKIPIRLSILYSDKGLYESIPLIEKYVMEVGKDNGKRISRK